jgi:serine protease
LGLGVAGCGGGGGGDGGGGTGGGGGGGGATSFNLSGTIAIAETAAVDSDTNDVNQADYVANDGPGAAQALTAPVLLVGSVNQPNTGPRGRNNDGSATLGDEDDWFRVDLVAGQVVELEFASNPADADVDLYLVSSDATIGGESIGEDTRFECVTASRTGSYFVVVNAFRRASIYNLRIGAPGTSATCAQVTAPLSVVPNQLVAEPKRGGARAAARAGALMRAAGLAVASHEKGTNGELRADAGPQLLHVPADPVVAAAGLHKLARIAAGPGGDAEVSRPLSAQDVARRARAAASPWPASLATVRYAKQLRASGAFEYVEPNRWLTQQEITGNFPPNDRLYSYQRWHYEQINLPSAMGRVTGLNLPANTQRPVVAVIDDGVMLDHPDLQPQLFSSGRAFVSATVAGDGDRASGDILSTAADQPVFHGTHVAGTVGAATYDGIGGAGTAPMAQLLPLRTFPDRGGRTSSLDVIQAMRYAARLSNRSGQLPARRADVINLSLGGDNPCSADYQTAVNDVRAAGTIVVAAAGNSGLGTVAAPASCNGVVAVSATDARRNVTSYSNTGSRVVAAAPGGDSRVSTTGTGLPDAVYSDVGAFDANGNRQPSFGGKDGTSMASPHVAGVMALMRFVNPGLTVAQVDNLFATGALTDDLGAAGRDNQYGFGLINARKAVDAALAALTAPPPVTSAPIVAVPSTLDFGALATSLTLELSISGTSTEAVVGAPQVVLPTGATAGAVTVVATAVNAAGIGRWTITVNRNNFAGTGTFYPSVNFALNTARVIPVQLTVQKPAAGAGAAMANFGPIYVLLIDPDTGNVDSTVRATLAAGRYSWSKSGYTKPRVSIIAGGDLDNDDIICQRGEPCGAYPVLPQAKALTIVELSGNRADLNFQVSPLAGVSPSSGPASAGEAGWRIDKAQLAMRAGPGAASRRLAGGPAP